MANYVQWRALVGPRYSDYDWSLINYGNTAVRDFSTTLAGAMSAVDTTMNVVSSDSFSSAAGLFIAGNGAGEAWEYVKYTSKNTGAFAGITRESATTREHNGVHSIGALVVAWYPITCDDGVLTLTETQDDMLATTTWEASIKGVNFPAWAVRNNHIVIVETRTTPGAAWAVELVGFLDSPSLRDDAARYGEWSVRISSVDKLYGRQAAKGVNVGNVDIAKSGTATGSASLTLAYSERTSGDFTAAAPSFDAGNVVDKEQKTLWIADRFTGTANTPVDNADPMNVNDLYLSYTKISQIHMNPAPGSPPGSRWIEITILDSPTHSVAFKEFVWAANGGGAVQWTINEDIPVGGKLILCEDEDVFLAQNPISAADKVLAYPAFFTVQSAAGGEIWLQNNVNLTWNNRVRWGTGNGGVVTAGVPGTAWPGPTVTAPLPGETMRYIYTPSPAATNPKDYWVTGPISTPGYNVDTTTKQFVMVSLPGIGLKLAENITATVPGAGALLKIWDGSSPSTSGLSSSGTLQIGDEQITYSAKTAEGVTVASRAANSTTAAIHDLDDLVYVLDSGTATDAPLITSIGWRRFNGTIYPKDFIVRRSNLPGTPRDIQTTLDWTDVATVTNASASSYTYNFGSPVRLKHFIIEMTKMTSDPARPRLNEAFAILDSTTYDATNLWMANGTAVEDVIRRVLLNAGVPNGAIITSGEGDPTIDNITTADANAWAVVSDLADMCGVRLVVGRDSKISMAQDSYWSTLTPTVENTWDETNTASVEKSYRNGLGVSQVKVNWRSPDETLSGFEVYPATPEPVGRVQETLQKVYTSALAAAMSAKKQFIMARYPYSAVAELADANMTLRPGGVDRLTWQPAAGQRSTENPTINRLYMRIQVDHQIERGIWSTVVNLLQVERESET